MRIRLFKTAFHISALCCLLSALLLAEYHPIEVPEGRGGTLRGLVKYPTETAPRAMFATSGDPQCPAGIAQEQLIVKQENRGIKNVLIVLEVNQGKPLKSMKAHLETNGCRFIPRIQWATKDAGILVTNNDHTSHKIRALYHGVSAFSLDLPANSPPVRRPLVQTGLFKINDERHLWMRGWLYVTDQPYVTITDNEGLFQLTDIPPGTYTLRAWHEGWQEKGTETGGQLHFQPMAEVLKVLIKSGGETEVLIDGLAPVPD